MIKNLHYDRNTFVIVCITDTLPIDEIRKIDSAVSICNIKNGYVIGATSEIKMLEIILNISNKFTSNKAKIADENLLDTIIDKVMTRVSSYISLPDTPPSTPQNKQNIDSYLDKEKSIGLSILCPDDICQRDIIDNRIIDGKAKAFSLFGYNYYMNDPNQIDPSGLLAPVEETPVDTNTSIKKIDKNGDLKFEYEEPCTNISTYPISDTKIATKEYYDEIKTKNNIIRQNEQTELNELLTGYKYNEIKEPFITRY